MGIVWIASYPKSGNTWMRFLIANYLAGPIERSEDVEDLIPGIGSSAQVATLLTKRERVYGKTHLPWGPLLQMREKTERAVVIVRHPKDVLLSNLNYQRILRGTDKGFTDRAYAWAFVAHGCDPGWLRVGYSSLESHARSWIEAAKTVPTLIVRYEDLKADPTSHLRQVISFLDLPIDEDRLRMAARCSAFDQMRALEIREKQQGPGSLVFPGPKLRVGWARYFMNSGQSGSKLSGIDPSLDAACDRKFAEVYRLLGYSA